MALFGADRPGYPADACRPLDRRWENDVLIVDTIDFLPSVLNAPVRYSDKLHVVERFTLDPKTMRITPEYTAEDSIYLTGKYSGSDVLQVADANDSQDQCREQGFIDHSKQDGR